MKSGLNVIAVALFSMSAHSQQSVTKPVLAPAPQEAAPATPPAQTPATVPPPADTASYVIGPEDSLQITVWNNPGMSGNLPVRPDGMISLSLVGELQAAGLTPVELSKAIGDKVRKFVQDPNVTVTVLAVHPKQVFLVGEVAHVGPVILISGMTPLQAIATAGGLSPYANAKRIYILRNKAGTQQKIPYDYKKALKDGDPPGMTLLPNDTIVVR